MVHGYWCPNCKMLVNPMEGHSAYYDDLLIPEKFSVGRYLIAGSDYTALHLFKKEHSREPWHTSGLKCPKCGSGGLIYKDLDSEARHEKLKKIVENVPQKRDEKRTHPKSLRNQF